jgi:hypothetical protein
LSASDQGEIEPAAKTTRNPLIALASLMEM